MQTHCPHCETKFRVTETQLSAANGFVRCGVCEEVFNFYEVTGQQPPETENSDVYLDADTRADTDEFDHDIQSDITAEIDSSQYLSDEIDETVESFNSFDDQSDESINDFNDNSLPEDSDSITSDTQNPHSAISKQNQVEEDTYNFFDDNDEESREHVVPEEYHDSYSSNTHSTTTTILWSVGILFLTATLLIEYAWFNRNQYAHIPKIQAEIEKLCQQFDCEKLSLRAPSKIELVTRNIYSHPNEKDVLMVDVTMKNVATFSQPYPIMKINFSDIRGGAVAGRNFLPSEYLSDEHLDYYNKQRLLPPNSSSNITMEILDPGKLAMTYEFDFL